MQTPSQPVTKFIAADAAKSGAGEVGQPSSPNPSAESPAPTYRGKYPDRIKVVCSMLRQAGDRYAPLMLETNDGARFVHRRLHIAAPMPKPGQEVEFWLYHVDPLNDLARDAFMRYGLFIES